MIYEIKKQNDSIIIFPLHQNIEQFSLEETNLENVYIYVYYKETLQQKLQKSGKVLISEKIYDLIGKTVKLSTNYLYASSIPIDFIPVFIEKETDAIIYLSIENIFYVKETKTLVFPNSIVAAGRIPLSSKQCLLNIKEEDVRNFKIFFIKLF